MIETNSLYDTYFLAHYALPQENLPEVEHDFQQGLTRDKGAIYLKTTTYVYDMEDPITTGTPTQFEYLANKLWVTYPLDRRQPWSVCYRQAIIEGLMFKTLMGLKRLLHMYAESPVVKDDGSVFQLENWIDYYNDSLVKSIDPQELEAGFKFYKLRDPHDYEYNIWDGQPKTCIRFTKKSYTTLTPDWYEQHLKEKYGSLEEAKRICQEKHPDIFAFAEKLKEEKSYFKEKII